MVTVQRTWVIALIGLLFLPWCPGIARRLELVRLGRLGFDGGGVGCRSPEVIQQDPRLTAIVERLFRAAVRDRGAK